MSSRNRSPNAMCVTPACRARSTTPRIRASYSALEQGHGSATDQSGSPTAAAWASTSSRRTACMATRPAAAFNVVSKPTSSTSVCCRKTCNVQALSLPELHESNTRFIQKPRRELATVQQVIADGGRTDALELQILFHSIAELTHGESPW